MFEINLYVNPPKNPYTRASGLLQLSTPPETATMPAIIPLERENKL